jgi:glycosyltransferase involved in cell wall biosynthesis
VRRLGIIGTVGDIEEYNRIKGFDMFIDICRRGGFEPVYIFGRDGKSELYDGMDALICCSQLEGGPLGIFEAASCGIPVLTRRVGNAQYVKGIALFDTADEALGILDIWNGNVDGLREYTKAVTSDVRINWSMRTLIRQHLRHA